MLMRQLPLLLHASRIPPALTKSSATPPAPLSFDASLYPEAAAVLAMGRGTSLSAFRAQQDTIMSRTDSRAALRAFASLPSRPPVLVLSGREDALIPRRAAEELYEAAAGVPWAVAHRLRGAHDPAAVTAGPLPSSPDPHAHAAPHSRLEAAAAAAAAGAGHIPRHDHGSAPPLPPPRVSLVCVPGSGHLVTMEAPEAAGAALLQWLAD